MIYKNNTCAYVGSRRQQKPKFPCQLGCNVANTRLLELGPPIAQGQQQQQQLVRVEGARLCP